MEVGLYKVVLLVTTGAIAGFVNVMAGGGSLLTMPALLFLGLPAPVANGSNRIAILLQNISAVVSFFRKGYSDLKLSLSLVACAIPGAIAGAFFGTRLSGVWFNRTLAAIMLVVMVLMALKKRGTTAKEVHPVQSRLVTGHILMIGAGLYGGFIQAGVGFIMMFVLHRVMGLDLVRVNMHKVFIVGCYTVVALVVFALNGKVNWLAGLVLAVGNICGGWFGARFAIKKGDRVIRMVLNVVLAAIIVKLLFV
jgi:hypothetical protein